MTPTKPKRAEVFLQNVSFLKSTTNSSNFPPSNIPEIAIVGRSNAGKSSVLNTLCKRKQLAHTSKTPGKTQLINFFSINDNQNEIARIVDLPGYGYAKVDKSTKNFWNNSLLNFLLERKNLIGIILVTDLRHAFGELDQKLVSNLSHRMLYFHILFNKSDKLNKSDQKKNLSFAMQTFSSVMPEIIKETSHSIFSSTKKRGVEELFSVLKLWLDKADCIHTI
jgi:GTP-binding protein